MRKCLLFLIGLFACQGIAFADDKGIVLNKADQLYKNKQYSQAMEFYEKALADNPDSFLVNFNAGANQYRLNQFDKAAGLFEKALAAPNKRMESWANYNLATTDYKLAEADEKNDAAKAQKSLESAEGYYKRAIELDERDRDAKINYELTVKKLQEIKQQQKQPQQGQGKQQDQQKNQQEQQGKSGQNKDKEPARSQSQTAPKKQGRPQDKQQESGQPADPEQMSEQEARVLLQSSSQDEQPYGKLNDKHQPQDEDVEKDW